MLITAPLDISLQIKEYLNNHGVREMEFLKDKQLYIYFRGINPSLGRELVRDFPEVKVHLVTFKSGLRGEDFNQFNFLAR
jgi:hypothetical protein